MKNVLVTGGAGFIGSHLCPLLCQHGYNVTILDNLSMQVHGENQEIPSWIASSEVKFIKGCVTDRKVLSKLLSDSNYLIHLAAETGTGQSMYEIEKYNMVNTQATAVILDIITNNKLKLNRVLLASSRSVYGEGAYVCNSCNNGSRLYPSARSPEQLNRSEWTAKCDVCENELETVPTIETDKIQPASIYASTKYAQEDLISICCESLGISFGILRLQNVYGEGQSLNNPYTGILSIFSTKIRRDLNLPIFEDGQETRDFVHVSDVANSFIAALACKEELNTVINVGTGELTTVVDIATKLSEAFGKQPRISITGQYRVGDIRHNRADVTKLKTLLNYVPQVNLTEGLRRFAKWVNTQPLPEDKLEKANQELKERNLMG